MAESTKKVYKGRGRVYLNGRVVGNASVLTIGATQETTSIPDYRTGSGGSYASDAQVTEVPVSLTVYDYLPGNLVAAALGTKSAVTSGAITDESIAAPADLSSGDRLVRTANMIDTTQTVTLTSDPAGTTFTEDTDYTVTAAGVILLESGSIADSADLLIDYTKKATDVVEALTTSAIEYELIFDGVNSGESGEPVTVIVYKFKPTPSEINLISDEFGQLELSGTASADTTITGSNLSQYYKVVMA